MIQAFWECSNFSLLNMLDCVLRILVSLACGALVGLEREKRLKNAGLRTHIIVAVASCMMMIVSKYGFLDVVSIDGLRLSADASRVAHGVISAIGFLGAGVIFVKRESVVGLTTSAGLWATVGIGITIGAGMYIVGLFTTALILFVQWILHGKHQKSHSQNTGTVKTNLTRHGITVKEFTEYMENLEVYCKGMTLTKDDEGSMVLEAEVLFKPEDSILDLVSTFEKSDIIDFVEVYPAL
jgi:putative Mg2+ transporter-C (MgtC) family protein